MKISELIEELESLKDIHGDLPVCLEDPDTGWLLKIFVESKPRQLSNREKFFVTTAQYSNEFP